MKTNQLILAAAIVALASCTKDIVVRNNDLDTDEIGFRAVSSMNTKANDAIISGTTYATDNTFQVWGWQSPLADFSEFSDDAASNFMSNLTIEYTTGRDANRAAAWRNADKYYYWPFTGKISFLAIHPSDVVPTSTGWDATNDKPKAAISDYTIAANTNETVDLMFATNEGARRADALPMVFKHALSQIVVNVKTDEDYKTYDGVVFDIESVTFHNIDLSGDVTYQNEAISWADNDTQTEDWVYYDTVLEDITNQYQLYGAANVMIPQPAYAPVAQVGEPGDANYVAPEDGTTITIGYSMQQDGNAKITGEVTVSAPQLWEAGKKYNYSINFRLNEIIFNPSVTDWVDVDVETIYIF